MYSAKLQRFCLAFIQQWLILPADFSFEGILKKKLAGKDFDEKIQINAKNSGASRSEMGEF